MSRPQYCQEPVEHFEVHDLRLRRLRQETVPGGLDMFPGRRLVVWQPAELRQQEVHHGLRWLQTEAGAGPRLQTHAGKHQGQDIARLRLSSTVRRCRMPWPQVRQGIEQACQRPGPYGFPGQRVIGGGWRGGLYRRCQGVPLALGQQHLVQNSPHGRVRASALPEPAQQGADHLRRLCPQRRMADQPATNHLGQRLSCHRRMGRREQIDEAQHVGDLRRPRPSRTSLAVLVALLPMRGDLGRRWHRVLVEQQQQRSDPVQQRGSAQERGCLLGERGMGREEYRGRTGISLLEKAEYQFYSDSLRSVSRSSSTESCQEAALAVRRQPTAGIVHCVAS